MICAKLVVSSLLHAFNSLGLMLSIPAAFLESRLVMIRLISYFVVGLWNKLCWLWFLRYLRYLVYEVLPFIFSANWLPIIVKYLLNSFVISWLLVTVPPSSSISLLLL